MTRPRRWLVPGVLLLLAIVLLVVGVVEWQMKSTGGHCPTGAVSCTRLIRPHRHHPLRAELLWAGAVLVAIIAAEVALLQRRRGSGLY
jgi:hypothetical protein